MCGSSATYLGIGWSVISSQCFVFALIERCSIQFNGFIYILLDLIAKDPMKMYILFAIIYVFSLSLSFLFFRLLMVADAMPNDAVEPSGTT